MIERRYVVASAFCLAVAAATFVRLRPLTAAGAAALALALAVVVRDERARLALLGVCALAAGFAWGSARSDVLDRSLLLPLAGTTTRAVAVVTAPARTSAFSVRAFARLESLGVRRISEPVLLALPRGRAPPLGARVELIATIERPREPDDDFDEGAWLRRNGVHVVLRAAGPWSVVGRRGGVPALADRLHAQLARTVAPGLDGERRALLQGIVLGEDGGLESELKDAFRAAGLYHLLAVSGQNIVYVTIGVLGLAWLLGVPRVAGQCVVIAAIVAYVAAVGWQPSVVRAGVAGTLASLAWLTARAAERWWLLLAGAAVLLAWNPYAARDPGFQLSFIAVAAIFLGVPRLQSALEGYPLGRASIRAAVAVAAVCGLATAPIAWLHFGAVPLYTVPANAIVAPVVGPLLGLALGSAMLHPLSPPAAAGLAYVNGWLAAYLAAVARAFADLPYAQLTTARSLAVVSGLGAFALLVPRLRPPRALRAVVLAVTVLIAAVGWRPPARGVPAPPHALRISFLDVGQGDATLIQVPEGAVLVDQGPPEARVSGQLRDLGVRRLDVMILTHPSRDNIGGAHDVLADLDVGVVAEPGLPFENPYGGPVVAGARRRGIRVVVPRAGDVFALGRLRLRVLWPPDDRRRSADPNDHAVVLLLSFGSFDAFLPADAESNVTLPLGRPVELYKVAHHGSRDDGLPALLERTRPAFAVVSAGMGNDYGHPAPSTLAALRARPGLAVYRTDHHGQVVVESDGERVWVRTDG